jgi:FkbM family methyltransferase
MSFSRPESLIERQPVWVTGAVSIIRALPVGRYRAANAVARMARRPFLSQMPDELGGAFFTCDLADSIAREVCFTGRYEPQETEIVRHLIRPRMSVIDVGANWGYFTLVAAHLVGAGGHVLALEPHPDLHHWLSVNVRRNGLSQVTCIRAAAADRAGHAGFVAATPEDGNSGLSRFASGQEAADFESPTETLDALVERHGLETIDLVKIDVEGAEARVLRGMVDGLGRGRYRYVLLECHPRALEAVGCSVDECVAALGAAGYRGWQIDHSPAMHRRAARSRVDTAAVLTPVNGAIGGDDWPHLLWVAPGEPVPAQAS